MKRVNVCNFRRKASLQLFAIMLVAICAAGAVAQNNGIHVSEAKVYDERTLAIMLEQLNEQLRTISFIDKTKLAAQLGLLQGFQSKEVSRALDIGTLPIPGLETTSKPDESGNLTPSEQVESRAAFTPKAPGLPSIMAGPKFEPVIGENASDLLDDQVNLTYQIFNLRMMLEKSLTDRLWYDGNNTTSRLIAVIGFDIEVHPPKDTHDRAAYVEITITPTDSKYAGPSLVALMPQEKTYNSAALSSKSNSFGGSAVAKIITVGYSEQRRGQTFYLFRDSDTATLTYAPKSCDKCLKFGWVFHPVLGRRAVAPNKRHMFAVIALPEGDTDGVSFSANVNARTYWRKYDRDKLTNGTQDLFEEQSFPISEQLAIPSTKKIQESLQPKIHSVKWYATDEKSVVVTVEGENFFTGTNVFLGSTNYDEGTGNLLIKSNKSLQVKTTVPALTSGEGVVNGRYGPSVPLYISDEYSKNVREGVALLEFRFQPPEPGRKFVSLSLRLRSRDGTGLKVNQLPAKETLIVSVEKTPVAQPYVLYDVDCESGSPETEKEKIKKHCVEVSALVPAELVTKEAIVSFKYPFRGPTWADSGLNYRPDQVEDILRVGGDDKTTRLAVIGRGFDNEWRIRLDQTYTPGSEELELVGETLMVLKLKTETLEKYKSLILLPRPYGEPIIKPVPPAKPPAPEPKLADGQNAVVMQDTAPSVEFKGSDLNAITKVTFDGRPLERKPAKDGKSIVIFLTRRVTAKAGPAQLLLWAGETILPANVTVQEKK